MGIKLLQVNENVLSLINKKIGSYFLGIILFIVGIIFEIYYFSDKDIYVLIIGIVLMIIGVLVFLFTKREYYTFDKTQNKLLISLKSIVSNTTDSRDLKKIKEIEYTTSTKISTSQKGLSVNTTYFMVIKFEDSQDIFISLNSKNQNSVTSLLGNSSYRLTCQKTAEFLKVQFKEISPESVIKDAFNLGKSNNI